MLPLGRKSDVIFEAPRWDESHKLVKSVQVTVIHNGIICTGTQSDSEVYRLAIQGNTTSLEV
jgi:hypothetical protein